MPTSACSKVAKGVDSRAVALSMVFKLIECVQARWCAVNASHLVALVRAGVRFDRVPLGERPGGIAA
ncbi:hypothetical protein ACFRCW_22605 [Streptomyces sp. NPDC056653]|uniref:hypothetical protein n=1 Tax=Streptomyces sp. NPDC056653 TaxID=3345894 RepID=UPI0036B2FC75